ncbi:MAG: hypothetical protein Q9223_007148, partial [Gallowayella weberi]
MQIVNDHVDAGAIPMTNVESLCSPSLKQWALSDRRSMSARNFSMIMKDFEGMQQGSLTMSSGIFQPNAIATRLGSEFNFTLQRQLLLEIRRELQDLRRDVSEIRTRLDRLLANGDASLDPLSIAPTVMFPEIPTEISAKFLDFSRFNPPESFQDLSHIPLKEGFDALVYHFSRSTVEFNPGFDQNTPEETQYVNLLKSQWILGVLEHTPELTAPETAPLWASALAEIKSDLIKEYTRFEANQLAAPHWDVIARLPDECFSIWVVEASPLLPAGLSEQRPLEDQILELSLPDPVGTRRSSLHVFRRSQIELRLVTTTRDIANPSYHQERDFIVNTNITRVIPAYASPGADTASHNLLLSNRQVQDLRWQYLRSAE